MWRAAKSANLSLPCTCRWLCLWGFLRLKCAYHASGLNRAMHMLDLTIYLKISEALLSFKVQARKEGIHCISGA